MLYFRKTLLGVLVTAAAIGSSSAAPLVAGVCLQLEAQLVTLDRGGNDENAFNYRQYDEAATKQRIELDKTSQDAARIGCQSSFGFLNFSRDPRCTPVLDRISRMQANYDRLRQKRDSLTSRSFFNDRDRSSLLRALADNNCGPQYANYRSGFFGLFSGFNDRRSSQNFYNNDPLAGGGTFRTLCVRTCDGYYFPISFSTVAGKFPADLATCQAMCPKADVALYAHRNPGEESEDMVSVAGGQPYNKLPNAFAYRSNYAPSCTCGAPQVTAASIAAAAPLNAPKIAGLPANANPVNIKPAGTGNSAAKIIPIPTPRPRLSDDPETLANAAGNFILAPLPAPKVALAQAADPAPGAVMSDAPEVRIVGPTYFYSR